MKQILKRFGAGMLVIILLAGVVFGPGSSTTVAAAKKDKTKPNVVLYLNKTGYTRGNVYIQVQAKDKSGIKSILIKKGKISKSNARYWKKASNITKAKKKKVTSNATYSVKVTDKAGNVTIKRITVTNIDKKKPTVKLSQSVVSGGVLISVSASDASGIKSVKWIKGAISDASSAKFNQAYNITKVRKFTVTQNGYYTVQAVDRVGNKSVAQIYVVAKQALYDMEEYYRNETYHKKATTVKDSLERSYTNALLVSTEVDGESELTYFLNGLYQYIEGDIACAGSKTEDAVMQIYADDVLVYTSETITATQEYKHFKVDIGNARFIKIKITDVYMGWFEEYILGNCYLYN